MAENQSELGSVSVEVRANLTPMQVTFSAGKAQAQQFATDVQAKLKPIEQAFSTTWGARIPDVVQRGSKAAKAAAEAADTAAIRSAAAAARTAETFKKAQQAGNGFNLTLGTFQDVGRRAAETAGFITGPLGGVASRLSILSSVATPANLALVAGSYASFKLAEGLKAAVMESEHFNQLQRQTEAVVRATGGAAGVTAQDVRALADELDRTTLIPAGEVESAGQKLLTFRGITKQTFGDVIRTAADMSTTFGSIDTAAIALGRAMQDPIQGMSALSRAGIRLTESEQEQITRMQQSGHVFEARAKLLDLVRSRVGGTAAGAKGGLTGSLDDLGDAWERVRRNMGDSTFLNDVARGFAITGKAIADFISSSVFPNAQDRIADLAQRLAEVKSVNGGQGQAGLVQYIEGQIAKLSEGRKAEAAATGQQSHAQDDYNEKLTAYRGMLPDLISGENAAVDSHLAIVQSRNEVESAENEAAYARGATSLKDYMAKRAQITAEGIRAEIEALKQQRSINEQGMPADLQGENAQAAEKARIDAQLIVKQNELNAAQVAGSEAVRNAVVQSQSQADVQRKLMEIYDGTAQSLREMAIQEKILNGLKSEGVSADSARGKALSDEIRQTEELNNKLQDRIRIEQNLQGVKDEIAQFQDEDRASEMFKSGQGSQAYAFLKEQELLRDAQVNGAKVTEEMTAKIHAQAAAYGQAKIASEQYRAAAAAEQAFAQSAVSATSDLVKGLITDSKNWKDHLINFFGDVAKSYVEMVGKMALAQSAGGASGGGGGGFNWAGLITMLLGSALGAGAHSWAGGGAGGWMNSDPTSGGGGSIILTHKGGRIGAGAGERVSGVNPSVFIGAPRYHRGIYRVGEGGPFGLKRDEQAAILQTGETVIPRGGFVNPGAGGGMGGQAVYNTWNINGVRDADSFMRSQRGIQRLGKFALGIQGKV